MPIHYVHFRAQRLVNSLAIFLYWHQRTNVFTYNNKTNHTFLIIRTWSYICLMTIRNRSYVHVGCIIYYICIINTLRM